MATESAPAPATPEIAPFWSGLAAGRLVLPKCKACGFVIWYPRPFCPDCGSLEVDWITASGIGEIYSYTVDHRQAQTDGGDTQPLVIAYVELAEGPRIITNLIDCELDQLTIGQPVRAVFPASEDNRRVFFSPTSPST